MQFSAKSEWARIVAREHTGTRPSLIKFVFMPPPYQARMLMQN